MSENYFNGVECFVSAFEPQKDGSYCLIERKDDGTFPAWMEAENKTNVRAR